MSATATDWNHALRGVDNAAEPLALRQMRYLTDAIRVQRFHSCVPHPIKQTVGEHTAEVAMLCDLLTPGGASAPLLRRALRHDLAELTWGDMPAPAKRLIGERLHAAEMETLHQAGLLEMNAQGTGLGSTLTTAEQRTLDFADRMSGALHCVYSRELGSKRAQLVYLRYRQWLEMVRPWNDNETAMMAALDQLWKEATWTS